MNSLSQNKELKTQQVHIETWEGRFTLDGRLQEPDASVMEQKMITVAAPNVIPKLMMSKVSDILTSFDLTINGVHVDTIKTHENSSHSEPGHADLALVRFQVDELNRSSRGAESTDWAMVKRELKRLKWCDNTTLSFITGPHGDESDFDLYVVFERGVREYHSLIPSKIMTNS